MDDFSAAVDAAFKRTKALLLPFQKAVWLKLFFLLLFSGGCGAGFSGIPSDLNKNKKEEAIPVVGPATKLADKQVQIQKAMTFVAGTRSTIERYWQTARPYVYAAVGGLIVILVVFIIAGLWLASRLQMVLVAGLREGVVEIRRLWRETAADGQLLFRFNLWIFACMAIVFVAATAAGAGGFYYGITQSAKGILVLTVLGVIAMIFISIGLGVLYWFLMKFLPIVMDQAKQTPWESMRLLWSLARARAGAVIGWLFLYMALAIGVSLGLIMLSVMVAIAAVLAGVAVSVAAAALIKSKIVLGVLAVAGGLIVFVFTLALMLVNVVPAGTFFTYVRMELIARALSRTPQSSPHAAA